MPFRLPLFWNRNAPERESYQIFTDAAQTIPDDLTGSTFKMQLRGYPGAPDPALATLIMAASGTPGFFLTDAINGWIDMTPPAAAVLQAIPGPFLNGKMMLWHDILRTWPDGYVDTFAYGPITLFAGVTVP
jgi:hypothetical protein